MRARIVEYLGHVLYVDEVGDVYKVVGLSGNSLLIELLKITRKELPNGI